MTISQMAALPNGQDIIADAPLVGWTSGPLPILDMELAAVELFEDSHPRGLWSDQSMRAECDSARRQILRAYARFVKMNRWTLSTMHERLEDGFARVVCGDVNPTPAQRATLRAYAFTCLQGLFARFSGDKNPMVLPDSESHTWMIPSGQGISEQWRQSYVATKFCEVLTALTCPGTEFKQLDVKDRTWLHQQTDQLVEDAIERFDTHPGDPEYKPEEEADYEVQ